MFPNRYPGVCENDKQPVAVGAGFAYKNGGGRWHCVCASAACHRALGLAADAPAAPQPTTRELRADGTIVLGYDPEALPLLRAMPGSRWDKAACVRHVSVSDADLPRTLELAAKLGLIVAPELLARGQAGTAESRDAEARAATTGLYPYQRDGVRWLALRDRALLGDDMGLGKTIQVLAALPEKARCIVVCPKSLKYNWRDEAKKWRPEFHVSIVDKKVPFHAPEPGEIVVLNYEQLPSWLMPKATGEKNAKGRAIKRAIIPADMVDALAATVLVADEAHAFKHYGSQRSKKVQQLTGACAKTWLLTGTPLTNKPSDLYSVCQAGGMAYEAFGSLQNFRRLFGACQNRWGGWDWGQPAAEVPERLRRVMMRRTKAQVLPDLPAKRRGSIVVNGLDSDLRRDLDAAWERHGATLQSGELPPFEQFSELRARLAESRIEAMLELVEQHEEEEQPLLVFSAHRAPVEALAAREGWAVILGTDTSAEERRNIVQRFQTGELKGVAMTIAAGGVGLTLTRANRCLFVDLAWNPSDNLQAEDRAHRIGSTGAAVLITHLVSDHPLDLHVAALIADKMRLIEAAVEREIAYTPKAAEPGRATPGLIEETDEELAARLAALAAALAEAERQVEVEAAGGKIRKALATRQGVRHDLPAPDAAEREWLGQALATLSAQCDGAVSRDEVGFNKADTSAGKWLALVGLADDDAARLAREIVRHYPGQVGRYVKEDPTNPVV